jgi:ubiquinone/menaquinone biosynthesis C-methylase UbiE
VTYTHGHHESVLRSHRWRTIENSAAYLAPHLIPGRNVLDVGCGPGTITAEMAGRVAPGHVVGIDAASEIVEQARAGATGIANVEFATGDVYALDFDDDRFDIVHAHQVLHHLSDPVAALREMRRVCRPDGIVAVRECDYAAVALHPFDENLQLWLRTYCAVHRANGGEPDAARRLLEWANAAGFSEVTMTASAWCFASTEDRAWWGPSWADRMTRSAVAEQAVRDGVATRDELERIAAAWHRWAENPDAVFIAPHGEIIAAP